MAVESTARSWFLNLNMFSNGIQSDSFVCVSVGGGNLEHKKLGAQVWYSHKQQTCTYMHGPRRDIDSEFNLDRRGLPFDYLIESKENIPDNVAKLNHDHSKETAMLLIQNISYWLELFCNRVFFQCSGFDLSIHDVGSKEWDQNAGEEPWSPQVKCGSFWGAAGQSIGWWDTLSTEPRCFSYLDASTSKE